jgi:triacylglycerol lipase
MPADIQTKIRAMGPTIDPPGTGAFYEGVERMFAADDVNVSAEISYGPDPRHLLQVYTPKTTGADPMTVIVLVHGGGFVGGSLQSFATPATTFAGLGFVAVNITYPLAPAAQFPAGPVAVGAAMTWARDHAAEYGGDPNRVFVLGASAGATHVADYVFRPSLNPAETAAAAGAILYSPNFVASTTAPSPYYGDDFASVATKLVPGNIERTSIPVLTTVTEFDPRPFQSSAATLYDELVNGHGVLTRLRQLEGHNHLSVQYSIGTADQMFLEEVLDFIAATPSRAWGEAS